MTSSSKLADLHSKQLEIEGTDCREDGTMLNPKCRVLQQADDKNTFNKSHQKLIQKN